MSFLVLYTSDYYSLRFLELWGEGFGKGIPFTAVCSQVSLCVISGCRFLYLFPSPSERSFSDNGWIRHPSVNIVEYCYETFYYYLFLSQYLSLTSVSELSNPWILVPQQYRVPSHGVYLKSNQTLADYFHYLCATKVLSYFIGRTGCRKKFFWLDWCLHFSSGSQQSTFPYQRHQNMRIKVLQRHQLALSMFSELCGQFLQQSFTVSLWKATYCFGNRVFFFFLFFLFEPFDQQLHCT